MKERNGKIKSRRVFAKLDRSKKERPGGNIMKSEYQHIQKMDSLRDGSESR